MQTTGRARPRGRKLRAKAGELVLERYDRERPHSALGYLTPSEFRERLAA